MLITAIKRFIVIYFAILSLAFAQGSYKPIPGAIPLQYGGYPATDLVLDGKVLLPEEAHQYYLEKSKHTRGSWTLAELNPSENDIWRNRLGGSFDSALDELPLKDQLDDVAFVSNSITRSENYRFTVAKDQSFYVAYIGPKVHNFLLRKNLLRKLGYEVPAVKYLKSLRVDFNTVQERDEFLLDFQATVNRDIERWITSRPENEPFFYAQDLIIMEDQNTIPNLSVGYVAEEIIDGRRILNSLIIPYALTDIPESVNMLSWAHGKIFSENVVLPFESSVLYSPTNDDAVWMTKRIMTLTERDWIEIVENSHLPGPVTALMLEKLKSRRNHLGTLFGVQTAKLNVNSKYSDQDGLVKNGKLEQEFFSGYGRRFKIPDPDSPLSFGEMGSLFQSKLYGQGIDLLVSTFNSFTGSVTDVTGKVSALNAEISMKANDLLKEGKPLKGLVTSYIFPTAGGRLILSRDIVAGSYLGTDNLIQLVDTIGLSINVGAATGILGVFAKLTDYTPVPLSMGASASLSRTYAHVKPITSVKKALKYPFKNMLIPFLKRKQNNILTEQSEKDFDKINEMVRAERDKEYEVIFEAITKELEVGESIIITDSMNLGVNGDTSLNLYNVVNVRAKAAGSSLVMSRLHILRKSQSVIQVYKDFGHKHGYEISLGMDKFVPILQTQSRGNLGGAKTKFYNVQLIPTEKEFKQKLISLGSVFKTNSLSALDAEQKPFILKHSFTELNPNMNLLIFKWNALDSTDNISISAPNGDEKKYIRRYKGYTVGVDAESYIQDLISSLTSALFSTQFAAFSPGKGNAGFTFYGQAFNKIQIYETEVDKAGRAIRPYSRLTRIWNGWQADQKKALKILNEIKTRYKFNFMPEVVLAQTKKVFLYNFNVNLYVHSQGIESFAELNEEYIKSIFIKHQSRDMTSYTGDDALLLSGYSSVIRWKKRYHEEMAKNNISGASKFLIKIFSMLERKLTVYGYELAFGKGNFLLMASIDGFRVGDENGDQPLISNTFGMRGNENLSGPTVDIQDFFRETGSEAMTEGEFYVNWLLGRII